VAPPRLFTLIHGGSFPIAARRVREPHAAIGKEKVTS